MKLYEATKEQIEQGTYCWKCANFQPVVKAVNGTVYGFCRERKTDRMGNKTVEIHNTSERFVCYNARKFQELETR